MIGRRPHVMVNAFRRAFGRDRDQRPAEATPEPPLPLAPLPGPPGLVLTWTRTRVVRGEWRLAGEGGTYATVRGKGRTFEARTAGAEWTLRGDWGCSRLEAWRAQEAAPVLRFVQRFFASDRIERTAGETLRWSPGFFGSRSRIETDDGRVLLEVETKGLWRPYRLLSIHEAARTLPDLPALVLLTAALPEIAERRAHSAH